MKAFEVNFDGLVGPTHNYAGLAQGNLAAAAHGGETSNPREAALQGLRKMKLLMGLGLKQGVLPPQERPILEELRRLGFGGTDAEVLAAARRQAPALLASCSSASAMWAANAATVSPSADSGDGKVHFTPANLIANFHRSLETATTGRILAAMFSDPALFRHHPSLPAADLFGDEGAANHTRLCRSHGEAGVQLFVYGRSALAPGERGPGRFPARQTLEASQAISRRHLLDPERVVFARQNPRAVDAGVFHNDVISVGNEGVFFFHEEAFAEPEQVKAELTRKFGDPGPHLIEVPVRRVTVADAVATYLFNSQLVTLPTGEMALIVPGECRESARVWAYLEELVQSPGPIARLEVTDLNQSMRNGGGPACLRLRVVLTGRELEAVNPAVLLTDPLYDRLRDWVERNYRDRLRPEDLADPHLLQETRGALDELSRLLALGPVYPFQHG